MTEIQTVEHDVLVIGAGGAGSARGDRSGGAWARRVGLVCKSLLGKAHTVMAEGGMAAAMGNVDDRDNWRVHFADTMRGGQYLNNWRMAELHAQGSAGAREGARGVGRAVRSHARRPDSPAQLRRTSISAARARRRSHGARADSHAAGSRRASGHRRAHGGAPSLTLLKDGDRVCRRVRLRPRARSLPSVQGEGRRAGDGRRRSRVQDHVEQLGVHGRRPCARVSRRRGAPGHGVRAVPSDGNDLAAERARHSRHGRRARRRRRVKESRRQAIHVRQHSRQLQSADGRHSRRRLAVHAGRQERAPSTRAADARSRRAHDRARSDATGRGSPHGGVFLDIAWIKEKLPNAEEHIKRKLPSMYHQFMQLAGIDITKEPMEIGPTTHYIMGGIRVDGDTQMSTVPGLFACGECAAGLHGANRLGGNSLSDLIVFGKRAGEYAAKFAKSNGDVTIDQAQVDAAAKRSAGAVRSRGRRRRSVSGAGRAAGDDAGQRRHRARAGRDGATRSSTIGALKQRAAKVGVKGNREYNPGWHTALDLDNLLTVSEAIARCAIERKESRGGHFRDDYPGQGSGVRDVQLRGPQRVRTARCSLSREPIPPMPEHLKAVIEEMK